jgi:hypothetical protein
MDTAERFEADGEDDAKEFPIPTKLVDATKPENVGRRLRMEGIVTALEETPYLVPKTVKVKCDRRQPGCSHCPAYAADPDPKTGKVTLTVKGTTRGILDIVNMPESKQRDAIRDSLRIPTCKSAEFTVADHFNAWDVRLMPQLRISGNNQDNVMMPAIIVGQKIDLNQPYVMEGKVHAHPKNQQAILVIDRIDQAEDSLNSFDPSPEELESLKAFRPTEWTTKAIKEKLEHVYADLEANVTRIYCRRRMHILYDLAWHSCLYFMFDGRLQNGWVNVLIAGDTSQGKSEVGIRLMNHYGTGERMECKNASEAGIVGGLEPINGKYFVRWGVIPTHDRRFVLMDEINGGPQELIWRMTDMRSSGIAEINKIEKRKTHARTRIVMTANARSNKRVSQFNFGIELIQELIGAPQDIRRFDAAILVSASQVDPAELNRLQNDRPTVEHFYTSDLCRRAVLWAWTRDSTQVIFEGEAEKACLESAAEMCKKFAEEMPLVDKGSMRHKLARLAIALAARTFSTTDDLRSVVVRPCHVEFVHKLLDAIYSDPTFGYADFSMAQTYAQKVLDPQIVARHIRGLKFPADFVDNILHQTEITLSDIQDWTEADRDGAQKVLSFLVRKHAIYRDGRFYTKTSSFIALLKQMRADGLPKTAEHGQDNGKEKF